MKIHLSDPHGLASLGLQDDLLTVCRIYYLPQLSYIDIAKQEQMAEMMTHWPLLKELAKLN